MRKQFEELHPLFDLEKDEQGEYTCVLTRVTWLGFELGKKVLQTEIDQLKAELVLCREENKGLVGSLSKQRQINIALNSETIKQREQIQHYMGKCVEQNKQVEDQQKRINFALHAIKDPEAHLCDQAWFALKALRGGDQKAEQSETAPVPKWSTIKVVCQRCGHYLNGCHCNHFGDQCPHLNTSMFGDDGLAGCFNCKKIINKDREVVGGVDDINLTR